MDDEELRLATGLTDALAAFGAVVFSLIFSVTSTASAGVSGAHLSAEEVAARARQSVVIITCRKAAQDVRLGSGFVASSAGLIVTNAHVVAGCDQVVVRSDKAADYFSAVIERDSAHDIAVLYAGELRLKALALETSSPVRPGQRVYAVGHPEGLAFSISDGLVSALREIGGRRLIQTTAPISPGSSGGPLINNRGRVVGMTTEYLAEGQNLNFAVPADAIADLLEVAKLSVVKALGQPSSPAPLSRSAPSAVLRLANRLVEAGMSGEAVSLLEGGLKRYPTDIQILLALGETHWTRGEIEGSKECAERIIALDPKYAPAHELLARVWESERLFDDARFEAETSLNLGAIGRVATSAHLMVAQVAAARGVCEVAVRHFSVAFDSNKPELGDVDKERPDARVQFAICLDEEGRYRDAESQALRALSVAPLDRKREVWERLAEVGLIPITAEVATLTGFWESASSFVVAGLVRNTGWESCINVRVVAEAFDEGKQLIGRAIGTVNPKVLPAGGSGSFRVSIKGHRADGTSYSARVASRREKP